MVPYQNCILLFFLRSEEFESSQQSQRLRPTPSHRRQIHKLCSPHVSTAVDRISIHTSVYFFLFLADCASLMVALMLHCCVRL